MISTLRKLAFALVLGSALPAFAVGCSDGSDEAVQDVTQSSGRFELFKGEDGEHYFQLIAANGEQLLRSEGYVAKAGAENGIESVQHNAASIENFKILEAVNGEYYFNLVAGNHQIIATSETYVTQAGAEQGAETVQRIAPEAVSAQAAGAGPKFESFKGSDGQTYFRLRAGNGEIVLQSEGYASPGGAESGIDSVEAHGTNPDNYEILEAQNGQYFFHLLADNQEIIGRGELYVSKYNAERGAETVRRIIRDLTEVTASDDDIRQAVEKAAEGLTHMSEADYPFTWVHAELDGITTITEELVRAKLASTIDNDPDADKPLADLYSMTSTWDEWQTSVDSCAAEQDDEWYYDQCIKQSALDLALENNLSDLQVYYFGAYGSEGYVDGVGVSILVVGLTPEGNLAGVRTIAIWT